MDSFTTLMDTIQREAPGQNAEVETILGDIERSIAGVESAIEGVGAQAAIPPPPPVPVPAAPAAPPAAAVIPASALAPNELISIKSHNGADITITLGDLRTKLNDKNRQLLRREPNNKFKQAIDFLKTPGYTQVSLANELKRLGIEIKNDTLQGGKKKGTKKQKGGFIYNLHTKRRSSSSSRKSSSRRRRRSSRSSTRRR